MVVTNNLGQPVISTPRTDAATAPTAPVPVTPSVPFAPKPWSSGAPAASRVGDGFVGGPVTTTDYDLRPGIYPTTLSLPTVLSATVASPDGRQAITNLVAGFKAKLGVDLPPGTVDAAMKNPNSLLAAVELTPQQLTQGVLGLNAAYKAGKLKDIAPRVNLLPQHFDLANLGSVQVAMPKDDLKPIGPGLVTGDLASNLSPEQVRNNTVMAEVFQRLSNNASAKADQAFDVTFQGQKYNTVDGFSQALQKAGYQVNVDFQTRVANFAALHAAVPGSNPVQYMDVAAPLMLKTGIKDANGKEAVLPAMHSEMVVNISGGDSKLDSAVKFYQGISGTGFFPAGLTRSVDWGGGIRQGEVLTGDKAQAALRYAGALTDVINTTAQDKKLFAGGYGVTSVCDTSVYAVQKAVTGSANQYPLLMVPGTLSAELDQHLARAQGNATDAATYAGLKAVYDQLATGSDLTVNETASRRALASMPWAAGREPFFSSLEGARILKTR